MKLNNENINVMRTRTKENFENQAKKIIAWSDKKLLPFSVHSTIRVPFSEVDKGHLDARSILAIVLEIINNKTFYFFWVTSDGFYRLGTGDPVLKQLYARSQFTGPLVSNLSSGAITNIKKCNKRYNGHCTISENSRTNSHYWCTNGQKAILKIAFRAINYQIIGIHKDLDKIINSGTSKRRKTKYEINLLDKIFSNNKLNKCDSNTSEEKSSVLEENRTILPENNNFMVDNNIVFLSEF
ncbi:hypothetical protein QTP88_028911 [Uroleucon formosanum]